MAGGYGAVVRQEPQARRGVAARAVVGSVALALLALAAAAAHMHRATAATALEGKDLNTYSDWLKTLNGPASYTGIGEETSDYGASQHNSKKGMRELVPGALPADAGIAQMQGADFVDDVVRESWHCACGTPGASAAVECILMVEVLLEAII